MTIWFPFTSGGIATDDDSVDVDVEVLRVFDQMPIDRLDVIQGCRIHVLWCQPVINGNDKEWGKPLRKIICWEKDNSMSLIYQRCWWQDSGSWALTKCYTWLVRFILFKHNCSNSVSRKLHAYIDIGHGRGSIVVMIFTQYSWHFIQLVQMRPIGHFNASH